MILYTGDYFMSDVMTIRVDGEIRQRLEKLSKATARTKSFLAAAAIRSYLDLNEWQIDEIEAGLREADAKDFASEAEIEAIFSRWRTSET
jgi:predicted transcriptional regulator